MHTALLDSLSREGGPITVAGSSMSPLYPDGEVVHVDPVVPEDLVPGDLVLIRLSRHLRLHRYAGRDASGSLITLGDARWILDAPVAPEEILGRGRPAGGWRRPIDNFLRWVARARGRLTARAA